MHVNFLLHFLIRGFLRFFFSAHECGVCGCTARKDLVKFDEIILGYGGEKITLW